MLALPETCTIDRAYQQTVSEYPLLIIEAEKLKHPQGAFAMATISEDGGLLARTLMVMVSQHL